jgi:hypothetical protein
MEKELGFSPWDSPTQPGKEKARGLKRRTSGAKALIDPAIYGTAEAVP